MSREELFTLFNDTLPVLVDKVVLDVGSRLGAVLYGVSTNFNYPYPVLYKSNYM